MLLPSTDLMRVCRKSGLSDSDVTNLIGALRARNHAPHVHHGVAVRERPSGLVTYALAAARTLLVSLH